MAFIKRIPPAAALAAICAASLGLMLWAAWTDSAVMDELAHIPAGYGYVHNLDYRLNPEHPPLIKSLALLPVLALNPSFPTGDSAWQNDVNGQWDMGTQFLYESGNDADAIIRLARLGPILVTLLLVVMVFVLARGIVGERWALLPAFLTGLSPLFIAHGHYVTTDVGAAFGVVFAAHFFLKFLQGPSKKRLLFAGLALGAAALMKFSTVLLLPFFAFLLLAHWIASVARDFFLTERGARLKRFSIRAWRYLRAYIAILFIAYVLVVYPVYLLFTWNYPAAKQASDTAYILTSFAGGPTPAPLEWNPLTGPAGHICNPMRCLAGLDIKMASNPVLRPLAEHLLGILMVFQRSSGGNTSYFWGEVSAAGSAWYFPVVFGLKEPLPSLILMLAALLLAAAGIFKKCAGGIRRAAGGFLEYLLNHFAEFSLMSFAAIYWFVSLRSPLNIGVRHLFPTIPLFYILAASAWKKFASGSERGRKIKYAILAVLLVWFAGETAFAAPYFLSYFNELGGGTWNGYHYVTDSNYDWGQDLLRLRSFVAAHPEIRKIAVDYFGGGNPRYYLGGKEIDWSSAKGNPAAQGIRWLAVSVNTLQIATQPLAPGQSRAAEDSYAWLTALRPPSARRSFSEVVAPGMGNVPTPDYRVGTSIFVYKLQ